MFLSNPCKIAATVCLLIAENTLSFGYHRAALGLEARFGDVGWRGECIAYCGRGVVLLSV
ncbi:hypothetical protein [Bartonella pachyuromydis]|uniref:hypothetical protein n=1 Tax=Bartonella pachyuromydis TaxID=931097 RepID=UPI0031EEEF3B